MTFEGKDTSLHSYTGQDMFRNYLVLQAKIASLLFFFMLLFSSAFSPVSAWIFVLVLDNTRFAFQLLISDVILMFLFVPPLMYK